MAPHRNILVLAILCAGLHLGDSACRQGWTYNVIANKCYKPPREGYKATFSGAVRACRSYGAELVGIDNQVEAHFLDDVEVRVQDPAGFFWVNRIDRGDGKGFLTADGNQVSSKRELWKDRSIPSNATKAGTCAMMGIEELTLQKSDCGVERYYACEAEPAKCPLGWFPLGEKCMRIYREPVAWLTARQMCGRAGAEMLSIQTKDELSALTSYSDELRKDLYISEFWFGASGGFDSDTLTWSDGTQISQSSKTLLGLNKDVANNKKYCGYATVYGKIELTTECSELQYFACMVSAGKRLASEVVPQAQGTCETNWIHVGESCVFVTDSEWTWSAAQDQCSTYNATLVNVQTPAMGAFLWNIRNKRSWIGLSRGKDEEGYRWEDGSALSASATIDNYPEDAKFGISSKACVANSKASQKFLQKFERLDCNTELRAICEKPQGSKEDDSSEDRPYKQGACEAGWEQRPGTNTTHCYLFQGSPTLGFTYSEARQICNSRGAFLVAINDQEESDFIQNRLKNQGESARSWIGALGHSNGEGWHWEDGSPFAFINIASLNGRADDCAAVNTQSMEWSLRPCSWSSNVICEKQESTKTGNVPFTTPPPQAGEFYECDKGWLPYEDRCFKIVEKPLNWTDASSACEADGANLASIGSKEENEFLSSQIPKDCKDTEDAECWRDGICTDNFLFSLTNCRKTCGLCTSTCHNKLPNADCSYKASLGQCAGLGNQFVPTVNLQLKQYMETNCARSCGCNVGIEQGFFVGLTAESATGHFQWSDGSAVSYTTWQFNEPDDFRRKEKDCVLVNTLTGQWEDQPCSFEAEGYICAKPKTFKKTQTVDISKIGCEGSQTFGYGNKCYKAVTDPKLSWKDANDWCKSNLNGTLANLKTIEESSYVHAQLMQIRDGYYWFGLTSTPEHGVWTDGTKQTVIPWEPEMSEDLTYCWDIGLDGWGGYPCDEKDSFVCESERTILTPVPPTHVSTVSTVAADRPITTLPPCPDQWQALNGFCYTIISSTSWYNGRDTCEQMGGWLASIHDDETGKLFLQLDAPFAGVQFWKTRYYWIGLEFTKEKGFTWHDRSPVDYFNWKNKPTRVGTSSCVAFTSENQWRIMGCTVKRSSICQIAQGGLYIPLTPPKTFEEIYCDADKEWREHADSCYKLHTTPLDWYAALKECQSEGGDLVSVGSAREEAFLEDLAKDRRYTGTKDHYQVWLGYNSLNEGILSWSDGSPSQYEFWSPGEPNGIYGEEKCIHLSIWATGWNDNSCTNLLPYVCEKPKKGSVAPTKPSPTRIQGKCPEGFKPEVFGSKCFYVGEDKLSWDDAQRECQSKADGANLASILNQKENMFSLLLIESNTEDAWFGLRREGPGRLGRLSDNSTLQFNNIDYAYDYRLQDQAVYLGRERDCGTLAISHPYRWIYDRCDEKRPYLCEAEKIPGGESDVTAFSSEYGISSCPENYFSYHGNCYKFVNESKTWGEARDFCRSEKNGDLAMTFDLYETLRFDYETILGSKEVWIGASLNWNNGRYEWGEGYRVVRTFWADRDPNHFNNNSCVALSGQFWDDRGCDEKLPFFCAVGDFSNKIPPTLSPSTEKRHCPFSEMKSFGDNCYLVRDKWQVTWETAKKECRDVGMELTSIHSLEESEFASNLLKSAQPKKSYAVWIGLKNYKNGYAWTDDSPVGYKRWAKYEPNGGESEECVETYENGEWNDAGCDGKKGYLCKTAKVDTIDAQATDAATSKTNTDKVVPTVSPSSECPSSEMKSFGDHCYLVRDNRTTWETAKKECRDVGMDLASIHSLEESTFVSNLLPQNQFSVWIGLERGESRSFAWTDGTDLDYVKWSRRSPNRRLNVSCASIFINGEWRDYVCDAKKGFVCKTEKL